MVLNFKGLMIRLTAIWILITTAITVQGECRAELARAMLSRSPQSHLTSLSSAKVQHSHCGLRIFG